MSYQEIIEYIINFDNELEEGYLLLKDLYKFAKLSFFENAKKTSWIGSIKQIIQKITLKSFNR